MAGRVLCGLLTAGAIGAVRESLGEYQVRDYADRDASIGLAGSLIAVVAAVVLIGAAGGIGPVCSVFADRNGTFPCHW